MGNRFSSRHSWQTIKRSSGGILDTSPMLSAREGEDSMVQVNKLRANPKWHRL